MSDSSVRPTLGDHLSMEVMGPLVEKRTGGYEVRVLPCLMQSLWVFLKGVVLGRARCDRLEILARLFAEPGHENDVRTLLCDMAAKRVNHYGKEPDSFYNFWFKTQFPSIDFLDLDAVRKLYKKKVRLGEMLKLCDSWLLNGIGFGARFPELTEQLWRIEYETHTDSELWARLRQAGLDIPEKQTMLPLEEMTQEVLHDVASYVNEFMPNLAEPLNLHC